MGKLRTELPFYQALVEFTRAKVCVEIGVAKGQAAEYLCRGLRLWEGTYWGFDRWEKGGNMYGQCNELKVLGSKRDVEERLRAIPFDNFHLIQLNTLTEYNTFKRLCPDNIDFAYIDGDHSYYGIARDFSVIYPKLSPLGMIVFHDICNIDGCREFMNDLRTKYNDGTFDILEMPWGNGKNNRYPGVAILMKRYHAVDRFAIDECNGSKHRPAEIERREAAWLQKEIQTHRPTAQPSSANRSELLLDKLGRYIGRKKYKAI